MTFTAALVETERDDVAIMVGKHHIEITRTTTTPGHTLNCILSVTKSIKEGSKK